MSTEEKFRAAVNVIRSLPKSGSYQPSTEMMLRFYSYYKQATEGKCNIPKPPFWDLRNKAKWESWNSLGNMPMTKAMEEYVLELQKIVETMSYTDNVAAFVDTVDSDLPAIPKDDLELVAGDILRKFKSNSSSASTSRDTSPMRTVSQQNGHYESEDEFIDTVDSEESDIPAVRLPENTLIPNGHATIPQHNQPVQITPNVGYDINLRVLEELRRTVGCLEKDMAALKEKMNTLEKSKSGQNVNIMRLKPSWWPFRSVTPGFLIVLIIWPIVANKIVATMRRKRSP